MGIIKHDKQIETPDLSIATYIDETPEGYPIYDDGYQKWVVKDKHIKMCDDEE